MAFAAILYYCIFRSTLVLRSTIFSMKLILSSAGFYTQNIIDECAQLVGKPKAEIDIAVINEAYAGELGDHRWLVEDLVRIKNAFGGTFELTNLLALDIKTVEERIKMADVIYVEGGNTDYLMSVFSKTGFDKLLPKLLKDKVYVGSSAGAVVAGKRVSTDTYQQIYGGRNTYGTTMYLGLVDFALKPHMGSEFFPKNRPNILHKALAGHNGTTYGLTDDSAIIIDENDTYIIGSVPIKITDGILKT